MADLNGKRIAILATHGDKLKKSRSLSSILATQWPEMWYRSEYRYALVGHLHHLKEIDQDVVILEVDKHSKTRIQFTRTAILDIIDSAAVRDDTSEPEETTTDEAEAGTEVPPIPSS